MTGVPVLRGVWPAAASGTGVPAETAPPSAGSALAVPGWGTGPVCAAAPWGASPGVAAGAELFGVLRVAEPVGEPMPPAVAGGGVVQVRTS